MHQDLLIIGKIALYKIDEDNNLNILINLI